MSHTMNIKSELRDSGALYRAAGRLDVGILGVQEHRLFSSREVGLGLQLPGWVYPVVIKQDGSIAYDDYNGRWGDIGKLRELEAVYGVEAAKEAAELRGLSCVEGVDQDGNYTLEIDIGSY